MQAIFRLKLSQYSQFIKYQKITNKKIDDIYKLYQFFMSSFLCQIVPKSSFYILTKALTT